MSDVKTTSLVTSDNMTRDIWDKMSLEERKEWNRPAYEALGVSGVEYLCRWLGGEEWQLNSDGDGVTLDVPHRVRPTVRRPVVKYAIVDSQTGNLKVSGDFVVYSVKGAAEAACKQLTGCEVIKLVEEIQDEYA